MDYRDERDALRARLESLEGALTTAQAELERMRATEAALDASRREIQRLRAEVEHLRSGSRPREGRGLGPLIAVGLAVMAFAFGAAYVLRARPAPSPVEPAPVAVVVASPPPTVEPAVPVPPPRPARPARPTPPARDRSAHAEWTATVTTSQGAAPPPGTRCKVLAELSGDGAEAGVSEVEVACGTRILYRSSDKLNGMANMGSDVSEAAGERAGTLKHQLSFQDQGARTGARTQISLDTALRTGVVWSENVPTFRAELRVDPWSAERDGQPLVDPENRVERFAEAIVRTGTVLEAEAGAPVRAGAACTVDVSPASSGQLNCRVRVRCGGALLYGKESSGYNKCAMNGGRLARLTDERSSAEDGDPALDVDLPENTVILSEGGDSPYKLTIRLTPEAGR